MTGPPYFLIILSFSLFPFFPLSLSLPFSLFHSRDDTLPLVFQSFDWTHGTFVGSIMRSQATSAADQVGLVNDPMAMKAFCGYNIKVL